MHDHLSVPYIGGQPANGEICVYLEKLKVLEGIGNPDSPLKKPRRCALATM